MKLYDGGRAPNPRRVRIFFAEKGVPLPELVPVDIGKREHKSEAFTKLNPAQRLPVLVLDDGTALAETIAICRYVESLHPQPPLFGRDAREQALVEMWNRRMELTYLASVAAAFRHIHPAMKEWEVPQVPEWGEVNKPKAVAFLQFMDRELADRQFVAGDEFTVADITMFIGFQFMKPARIQCPQELTHVWRWYHDVAARPSADA